MFFYDGYSCPYCNRPFKQDDDIVSCPVCGAPHHRQCWKDHGVCAHEADHNTDKQWTRDNDASPRTDTHTRVEKNPCPNCGADNSPYAEICSHCGRPLQAADWSSASHTSQPPRGGFHEYAPFRASTDRYAGISPSDTIDGETVEDIATAVKGNTTYYLPRFRKLSEKKRTISWNWAAFLIPSYWLLYRKQYLLGCIVLALEILCSAALLIAIALVYNNDPSFADNTAPTAVLLLNALRTATHYQWIFYAVYIMEFVLRIGLGLWGNCFYKRHTLKTIRRTREMYPEGYSAQLSSVGGTSVPLACVAYLCMNVVPTLLFVITLGV